MSHPSAGKRFIFAEKEQMGILKDIGTQIRYTVNLSGYIDTESAEKAIRSNIYFGA